MIGILTDPRYQEHDTGEHPENRRRLSAIDSHLAQAGWLTRAQLLKANPIELAELVKMHDPAYVERLETFCRTSPGRIDEDTVVMERSFPTALLSAGGALEATQAVLDGRVQRSMALVRPPGHHALKASSMGFCLFGNMALAAQRALDSGLKRVAVLDWDVHHGNGTQSFFYDRGDVFFVDWHQSPHWPHSGDCLEVGQGQGYGTTLNLPVPAETNDDFYLESFEKVVKPALTAYQPQLIFLSAGYDAHWMDPLGQVRLSISGFAELGRHVVRLAEKLTDGKLVVLLEGGYNLEVLPWAVGATLDVLADPAAAVQDPLGKGGGHNPCELLERLISHPALA